MPNLITDVDDQCRPVFPVISFLKKSSSILIDQLLQPPLVQSQTPLFMAKSRNLVGFMCKCLQRFRFFRVMLFYQVEPKTKRTIDNLSHPQREKTRGHLVPTADGAYKLRQVISITRKN